MSQADLLAMLDLAGKDDSPASVEIEEEAVAKPGDAPPSPTALQLDLWGRRKGLEYAGMEGERAQKTFGAFKEAADVAADFHGVAFEPEPLLSAKCVDEQRHAFVKQLLDTPECQELRASTMLDEAASELATLAFAEQFVKLVEQEERDPSPGGTRGNVKRNSRVIRAATKGLKDAARDVQDLQDAMASLGGGGSDGCGTMDAKKALELYRKVRSNEQIRKICQRMGRFRRVGQSRQRQKQTHGLDDMVNVVQDGDLGRILPSELALLAVPELEDEFFRRVVEKQTLCRDYRAVEPVGKGPIVCVVDESGSMRGEKVCDAKAIALTLGYIARQQNRWIGLIAFSGGTEGRVLALPPGKWDEEKLMEWLGAFLGGGTILDVPLAELPNRYWQEMGCPRGKTDVVCITDAICQAPPEMVANFNAWKSREQVRMISIIVGETDAGDLKLVSEEVHIVKSLACDEEAVGVAFSV